MMMDFEDFQKRQTESGAALKLRIVSDSDNDARHSKQQLQWLDMSNWDTQPLPRRKWAILDRVPLRQAGLFSGEGGTGKSIIELQKNVAHVTGKDWLGSMPEQGPAF